MPNVWRRNHNASRSVGERKEKKIKGKKQKGGKKLEGKRERDEDGREILKGCFFFAWGK